MAETENQLYRTGRAWCIQHPVTDGVACGVAFFIVSSLLIGVAFPAWAVSIPITERIVINLGDLPPWIGAIVAVIVYLEARKAKKNAAEAARDAALGRAEIKAVAVQIDGMLADRDKAKVREGEQKEKIAGEEKAATLAQGQSEGRDNERASVAAKSSPAAADGKTPLPVADDRTAKAGERVADATERSAEAHQRVASATEEKK